MSFKLCDLNTVTSMFSALLILVLWNLYTFYIELSFFLLLSFVKIFAKLSLSITGMCMSVGAGICKSPMFFFVFFMRIQLKLYFLLNYFLQFEPSGFFVFFKIKLKFRDFIWFQLQKIV